MKNNLFVRLAALLLCGALLFPLLPQALAAPEDEEDGYADSAEDDTADGEDTAAPAANKADDIVSTGGAATDPQLEATAAILVNPDTGMVLYEKNADAKRFPASTTKVMTALLVLENASMTDTVTATAEDFADVSWDASNADIKEGETVTIEDLLYALMLPSANEAANILARHVGGTKEAFVQMMNEKAAALGCTGTHFVNPNGLHDSNHYTTARDLLTITEAAMEYELFQTVVNTAQYRMKATNMHEERIIFTTNQLIYSMYQPWYNGNCKGVKTGHTSEAGNCLVAYYERGKTRLYSVVLGCADAADSSSVAKSFTETNRLFSWGYENFVSTTLAGQGDAATEIKVHLSTDTDRLVLTARQDLVASIPKDVRVDEMEQQLTVPEEIDAPISAGQSIGSLTFVYDGITYGTVELVALNDVEVSRVLYYADKLENFFKTPIFRIALVILVIFLVLYVLSNLAFGGMRRRKKRRDMRARYENSNYQRRRRR